MTPRDTRTLGTECHDLIERLYRIAATDGDETLAERCSSALEALQTLPGLDEPLRLEPGKAYVSRDGRRVRLLATDYRYDAGTHVCLAIVCEPSGNRERVELYTIDGRRYLGRGIDPMDIVGLWHDGLSAPAPAMSGASPQAAA